MNALSVLFGGSLYPEASQEVWGGKSAVTLAVERAGGFPGVSKTVLLVRDDIPGSSVPSGCEVLASPGWTKRGLLQTISERGQGFDLVYVAWADCPFLDPALAGAVAERHLCYAAEYSYADGWPYGFSPEVLAPGTAGILLGILGGSGGEAPERDAIFSALRKDINAFDIEAEISREDLRVHRLSFCADSWRNLMLLRAFAKGGIPAARDAGRIIAEKPALLRTLPAFYPVQVSGPCPQTCSYCPYPRSAIYGDGFMESGRFDSLAGAIADFSGDAVIDLSLWGELSLHPEKIRLVASVLSRPELALVVETSGLGWKTEELEECSRLSLDAAKVPRRNPLPPLSWIVSLDAAGGERYKEMRGAGFPEALACAKKILELFPSSSYVQAVRTEGAEEDAEQFYRHWKEVSPGGASGVIIQKYDDFCGVLPRRQASDLSPVERRPCWHIMRDMPILVDGTALFCRETLSREGNCGNVFGESLDAVWQRGMKRYAEHCRSVYSGPCAGCDEYYTYNF
jgi:spiro-SPASM protein